MKDRLVNLRNDDNNSPVASSNQADPLNPLLSAELTPLFRRPFLLDKPSAWFGHIPLAHWLIRVLRPRVFVELGTHAGVSYSAFCEAVLDETAQTRCFAVDSWSGDQHAGMYSGQIFDELKSFHDERYSHFSTLLRSTFDEALSQLNDDSIDLLHIDGFHTYDAVKHDFEAWLPKLSNRSVVLFHDTNEYKDDFGVWRFWAEIRKTYPSFEFLHSHGLGLLVVGDNVPAAITDLCQLNDDTAIATIRDRFHATGAHWVLEAQLTRDARAYMEQTKRLTQERVQAIERYESAEKRLASLEADKAQSEKRVKSLESDKARADARAAAAETRLASLESEKAQAVERAASAETRIAGLESEKAHSVERAASAETRIAGLESEKAHAVERAASAETRIAGLESEKAHAVERAAASKKRLRNMRHAHATLLSSTAWRLTKPLRAIGDRTPAPLRRQLKRLLRVSRALITPRATLTRYIEHRRIYKIVATSGLFDKKWYFSQYPDIAVAQLDPIKHYINHGVTERKNPSAEFDTQFYLETYAGVRKAGTNPLFHYITVGKRKGRSINRFQLIYNRISGSPLFDKAWYLSKHLDVANAGLDPVTHYIQHGASEGRNPSDRFETQFYLDRYPDIRTAGINPLYHYLTAGQQEGRCSSAYQLVYDTLSESPLFNKEWYLSQYSDVATAQLDPVAHYIQHGAIEGRNPSQNFETQFYLDRYPDVRKASVNPLYHYLTAGQREGRQARRTEQATSNAAVRPTFTRRSRNQKITYGEWIAENDTLSEHDRTLIRTHIACFNNLPTFSILMSVQDTPKDYLRQALDSVIVQLYGNWELCAIDDASASGEIRDILKEYASRDTRIKPYLRSVHGGISACTNTALDLASGDWVVPMGPDDVLAEHALYLIAESINAHPDAAVIYSDEDSLDAQGHRVNPYFKPDWDYDLFLGQNLLGHLGAYRADLARQTGGYREGFDGAQDWDFALRVLEATPDPKVCHVPFILYHGRRMNDTLCEEFHSRIAAAAQRAVNEHLERTAQAAVAVPIGLSNHLRIKRELPAKHPLVSIIIPTKDQCGLLRACIEGIVKQTDYQPVEIVVVDNGSSEADALEFLADIRSRKSIKVVEDPAPFNFSRLVNRGVAASSGEICVLMNNDVDVINSDWLDELVSHALRPEIGAVGAKLYYGNDTLQHGGVILGIYNVSGSVAGHAHRTAQRHVPGYGNRLQLAHSLSCVTGACVATRREIYDAVGGFNEPELAVSFNDVDFCLRVRHAGYKIVWTPHAELYHYESVSRGDPLATPKQASRNNSERAYMRKHWAQILDSDPYYNPNLSLDSSSFDLAETSRVTRPWNTFKLPDCGNLKQEAAAALLATANTRLARSVAYRLSHIDEYKRHISEYLAAREERVSATPADQQIVVYTAICGGYDSIKLPEKIDPRFDYVLFTDTPTSDIGVYQVRPITYCHADAVRSARFVKTHPHLLLGEYDLAIWIDANIMILGDIYPLIEGFLASGKAFGAVPHPMRQSIYEEHQACIEYMTDDQELMQEQLAHYRSRGFEHDNLIESNLLMFDLRNERTRRFLDTWWAEIDRYSRRDQLSINYALRQSGSDWYPLTQRPNSIRNHPDFALVPHDTSDGMANALIDTLNVSLVDPYAGVSYAAVRDERIAAQKHRRIDIVVCIHNALEDVKRCLESIVRTRASEQQRLILIDDGSDAPTAGFLATFANGTSWCQLQRSEEAQGYTKAANKGLAASSGELVILLNSDTIVTDGWAEKMADAVFSTAGAGIVGPMSSAASHQSLPEHRGSAQQTAINDLPAGLTAEDMNRYCEQWTAAHVLPRVPLVHGFCFGVTREAIDRIGFFDNDSFPRGYGEENDYCLRAVDQGVGLVVATHTFVFHAKSKSYVGPERVALMQAGSDTLTRLHGRARVERAVRSMEDNPIFVDLRRRARRVAVSAPPPSTQYQRVRNLKLVSVLALLPQRAGGGSDDTAYIRVLSPLQHPSLSGVLRLSLADREWSGHFEQDHAALLIQRDAVKSPMQARELVARCRRRNIGIIYEIDDDLLNLPDEHPAATVFSSDIKAAMQTIARHAQAVVVSTVALQQRMTVFNRNVFVLPNALDERLWQAPRAARQKPKQDGQVRILYMGTRTHDSDLALITDSIRRLKAKYGDRIAFTCIGGFNKHSPETITGENPPEWANTYPAFARWMARSCRYDIAIAPLADNSFNRHKSYLKYLDYGICGFAPVLSDVQTYQTVVRPGETGVLVRNTAEDWYDALSALIDDPVRRSTLAMRAQEDVLSHHTLAAQAEQRQHIWSEILSGLDARSF